MARTIAQAKREGKSTFTGKDGKEKAAVTREELTAWEKKTGSKGLRAYLNAQNRNKKAAALKKSTAASSKAATAAAATQRQARSGSKVASAVGNIREAVSGVSNAVSKVKRKVQGASLKPIEVKAKRKVPKPKPKARTSVGENYKNMAASKAGVPGKRKK
ncbi:hypothetical protein [Zhongshania aliphaticivorans]|jgi:hypothetical protein|uniref:hypothetical protein n=1 Tax=Zhongshania aliphaticivorans TaxID=1470434 RepID=UPI0039C92BE7|tara:strand:- start:813 stop:1292 length:480 start_codon:yes stop_codon:yes gene_type:complete